MRKCYGTGGGFNPLLVRLVIAPFSLYFLADQMENVSVLGILLPDGGKKRFTKKKKEYFRISSG